MELNKIYNEDCLSGLKKIEDNSVDLILTSPPYNIGIDYDTYDDNRPWDEYYAWCGDWLKECFRVLKPQGGRIALNHYFSLGTAKFRTTPISHLDLIMERIGFKHHAIAQWSDLTIAKLSAFGSYLSASAPYVNSPFEGIIIDYKDEWKKGCKGESDISKDDFLAMTRGVWNLPTETRGLTKANFSVPFAQKIIQLLSYKGDVVLDPFMGSGTTAVAAMKCDRRFIGFELSPNYHKIAEERLETERLLMSQMELF